MRTSRESSSFIFSHRSSSCLEYSTYVTSPFSLLNYLYIINFCFVDAVKSPESLGSHLASLLSEAEHRVQEFSGGTSGNSGTTLLEPPSSHKASFSTQHNNLTGCSGSTEDKQLALWERRARALRKMLLGFDQARKYRYNLYNCEFILMIY